MTNHRVIFGDSRAMPELADQSVHLVVTSPPYWQIKDYGAKNQIGFHDDYREYIANLNLVWEECARVLHPGCRLCVNVGDQFARAAHYGRYKVIPIREEIVGFCEKQLVLDPEKQRGLDYMGAIIWQKVTTCNTSGGATIMGSFPFPRNGIIKIDYEFILTFKKPGKAPDPPSPAAKEAARLTTDEWNEYFYGHWNFPGVRQSEHPAAFPLELPSRLIRMFTFPGETVLDPFLGSGTTSVAAQHLNRHSVGYELNPEFRPTIERRIQETGELFDSVEPAQIESTAREKNPTDFSERIARWGAGAFASSTITRTADSREMSFGTRVTVEPPAKTKAIRVKDVPAPNRVELSDGRVVQLLGLALWPGKDAGVRQRACDHLREMVRGQAVQLSHETNSPGEGVACLAYVHLSNRKFVNARMIRDGFARADRRVRHLRHAHFTQCEEKARNTACGLWEKR